MGALSARAVDWPQFLGPDRNGVSADTNLALTWPKEGPKILWKTKVGEGWSGPVVSSNRVVVFHRLNDKEAIECLNATNGVRLWRAEYSTTYRDDFGFDEGPRATPAVEAHRLFTFGADGILNCWDFSSGANLWRVDTRKEFNNAKPFFGIACSPLVEGNAVILNIGGSEGAGIVAFEKATGKVRWKATEQEASHSSPVSATIDGQRYAFVFARGGLVALRPNDGKVLWDFPWQPRIQASVSAATPLIVDLEERVPDLSSRNGTRGTRPSSTGIFISASYGAGAALLRFNMSKPEVIWSGDDLLSNHYATSVHQNGFLYGFDGRQEQRCHLRCVELKSGKIRWSEDQFGAGTLMVVRDKLLILTERGELLLAHAAPEKFAPISRAQILGVDVRAHPALARGLFYARDKGMLVCVDLRQ